MYGISDKRKCRVLYVINLMLIIMVIIMGLHYGTFKKMMLFLGFAHNPEEQSYSSYEWDKIDIYKYCPCTDDSIIFIGDSITDRGEF